VSIYIYIYIYGILEAYACVLSVLQIKTQL
jgi:hypothetical protein